MSPASMMDGFSNPCPLASAVNIQDPTRLDVDQLNDSATRERTTRILWSFFERVGETKAKCNRCERVYSTPSRSTSTLWRHLGKAHKAELDKLEGESAKRNKNIPKGYPPNSDRKRELDQWLCRMIATDLQPISIVEDVGFKNFCAAMDPFYSLPTRRTLSNVDIPNLYTKVQDQVKTVLRGVDTVSITTDLWSSKNCVSFIAVTVHYFDEETLTLQALILDCLRIRGRHTAQLLGEELKSILQRNALEDKVLLGITDNGANMVKAIKDMGIKHFPCYAHTLNLVALSSMRDVPAVMAIKEIASKVVELTRRSTLIAEAFETIQKNQGRTKVQKLIQDVPTRWNSSFEMMERLLELRGPVSMLLTEPGMRERVGIVDSNTWQGLQEATEVLRPLYEATIELSGERCTTGSKIIPLTKMLFLKIDSLIRDGLTGSLKSDLALAIQRNLHRRFGMLENNVELAIATMLDPRFKTKCFRDDSKTIAASNQILAELTESQILPRPSNPGSNIPHSFLWESFDEVISDQVSVQTVLQGYLNDARQPRLSNPVKWWREIGRDKFPPLLNLAKKYLSIPATSVPSERVFSVAGQVISKKRNRLADESARKLICLHRNLEKVNRGCQVNEIQGKMCSGSLILGIFGRENKDKHHSQLAPFAH
ncbi:zinc finger BED domain-containing protein 4-like [Tigriopus californicus]|uniref:zinc finger BED domain-containing protein 4-like n=1 Tax=Tigriopus californicus TaxID=6832 RepID=UPI0027DA6236|nr:zinc finger BED domain-containing protein 4-like [Tigriopus californicus]